MASSLPERHFCGRSRTLARKKNNGCLEEKEEEGQSVRSFLRMMSLETLTMLEKGVKEL